MAVASGTNANTGWTILARSTSNFRVTGRGHHRIEALFHNGCRERGGKFAPHDEKQPEQRIAMWLCCHATSFVMIDARARSTVIGLEREEDAHAITRSSSAKLPAA